MNVPEVAFKVPSFVINPLVNVLTVTTPGEDTFKLPPLKVPIVFPDAASVSEPPLIVVKYAAPPLRLTVPAVNVVNRRFAAPVRLVVPAPPKAPIATEPLAAVNASAPPLLTLPREPAEVAVVPNIEENVADPPEDIFKALPPLNSVPTAKVPLPTFNVPV